MENDWLRSDSFLGISLMRVYTVANNQIITYMLIIILNSSLLHKLAQQAI